MPFQVPWRAPVGLLAVAALAAGCSKLPEPKDLSGEEQALRERGRALVERAVAAHGGLDRWRALGDVAWTMRDTWSGIGGLVGPGFPVDDPRTRYFFNWSLNKGRMEFLDAPGVAWGHDSREGWCEEGGRRTYDRAKDATFLVPTEAYFFALPFKFLDPGVVQYDAGRREADGKTWETALITFEAGVGVVQDRYLAYFDPETGRLGRVTFTVLEQPGGAEGLARYTEWQVAGGLVVPKRIDLDAISPISFYLHSLSFEAVDLSPAFDRRLYEKPDAR
ncbi:MAG: hypothetical protein KC466_03925 [Myxococcales bacterium]|nr:hypothetical protein [Myxococcales bacterium]